MQGSQLLQLTVLLQDLSLSTLVHQGEVYEPCTGTQLVISTPNDVLTSSFASISEISSLSRAAAAAACETQLW